MGWKVQVKLDALVGWLKSTEQNYQLNEPKLHLDPDVIQCYELQYQPEYSEEGLESSGKAGRSRWMGRRPRNRGVVMNPVDHPMDPDVIQCYELQYQPEYSEEEVHYRFPEQHSHLTLKEGKYCVIKLPSGEVRQILSTCKATIGSVGNSDHGLACPLKVRVGANSPNL